MVESFFLTVNEWIAGGTAIAALGCFVWGMISVLFSPCHLASIPLIIAYVGGQHRALSPKQAGAYAALFTLGLFITITVIGIVCALLGRMLGDVGNYWQILIGLLLVWVALGILGVEKCAMSGSLLYRINLKGLFGSFALGLAYGVLQTPDGKQHLAGCWQLVQKRCRYGHRSFGDLFYYLSFFE
jgi:cytochrome c-type biogenesis protein